MLGQRPPLQRELFCYAADVPPTKLAERTRALSEAFDWDQVRARAQAYFDPTTGRPSLDPVVVVKLLLLHKLTGCRSWRGLLEFASDSMACRDFLGYAWSETLPSHQALCDWRGRLGPEFFEDLLVDVVRHCQREGMVLSSVRVVDATAVKAQANREGPTVWVDTDADELAIFEAMTGVADDDDPDDDPAPPTKPSLLSRPPALRDRPAQRSPKRVGKSRRPVSEHDAEARLSAKPGLPKAFYYQVSMASDPLSGLITSTIVKPTEEPATLLEHLDCEPGEVAVVVADCHYDTVEVHAGVVARGAQASIPFQDHQRQHGLRREQFTYNAELDVYQCPEGQLLRPKAPCGEGRRTYLAPAGVCGACRRRAWCTTAGSRSVSTLPNTAARDAAVRGGPEYARWQAERRVQEHIWQLAKRDHGMARADGLGTRPLRISAALVAVCINVRKLLRWRAEGPRPGAGAQARVVVPEPRRTRRWRARACLRAA